MVRKKQLALIQGEGKLMTPFSCMREVPFMELKCWPAQEGRLDIPGQGCPGRGWCGFLEHDVGKGSEVLHGSGG